MPEPKEIQISPRYAPAIQALPSHEDVAEPNVAFAHPGSLADSSSSVTICDLNFSSKLRMITPSRTRRFDRNVRVEESLKVCKIERMQKVVKMIKNIIRDGTRNWVRYVNPDGQPYYCCTVQVESGHTYKYVTEEDLTLNDSLSEISSLVDGMQRQLESMHIDVELCIVLEQFDEDDDEVDDEGNPKLPWCYYLVDVEEKAVFWLQAHEVEWVAEHINGIPGVSHMVQWFIYEYWTFSETFPHIGSVSDVEIDELMGILSHGSIDMTASIASTFIYTPDDCSSMLNVIRDLREMRTRSRCREKTRQRRRNITSDESCNPYLTWIASRLMAMISNARFMNMYGYHGARLDPEQSIRGPVDKYRTLLIATVSPILFYAPEMCLERLERIWIDKAIKQDTWIKFTEDLRYDWNLLSTNATIVLTANVAYIAIPNVADSKTLSISQVISLMSIITSLGSVILSLLLLRQHKKGATETAAEAARYLKERTHHTLGLEILAIMYSLPFSLLMWSVLYFVIAMGILCFQNTTLWQRTMFAFAWLVLAILVGCTAYIGWKSITPLAERLRRTITWIVHCWTKFTERLQNFTTSSISCRTKKLLYLRSRRKPMPKDATSDGRV